MSKAWTRNARRDETCGGGAGCDDDTGRADEGGGVAAPALQHKQVVAELLDLHHLRRGRTGGRLL